MFFYNWYSDFFSCNAHALIAGCTGSGKSVLLNGLICRAICEPCSIVLIDPKKVELHQYKKNKHVVSYADTIPKIERTLKRCIKAMNQRLTYMRRKSLRTFDGMPIYIFIDELADLMIDGRKAIEPLLIKLSTLGRAARIHIIACTQKVKSVLTPWLRANFDYRISLRCTTPLESTGIIETPGAENLPRFGSCIVRSPNWTDLQYLKVKYYSDQEINKFIK